MSHVRTMWSWAGQGLALAAGLATLAVITSTVASAFDEKYVGHYDEYFKYYVVTAEYQGKPENLNEIANRFLGTASRSPAIFYLNVGRRQSDGAALTDPAALHVGWALVLPFDAVGPGVEYGPLPAGGVGAVSPSPSQTRPAALTAPPSTSRGATGSPRSGPCVVTAASSNLSDWARLRLAPDQAWDYSRGAGVTVAVIDSGVDAEVPQLAGRVSEGADVVAESGSGNTDCLGSGTAMAGIIAARPTEGNAVVGVAPDASILPIRVATTLGPAQPADAATAIEVATSAGAKVIAVGSYVDVTKPKVAKAITDAVDHDVLVVFAAPAGTEGSGSSSTSALRVGGVGVDGQLAAEYRIGDVDVVAPAVNITTLGTIATGTQVSSGTQYAVAFVAGQAALVRAAYPHLTASEVKQRIQQTADLATSTTPDPQHGWGMINLARSVTVDLAGEHHSVDANAEPSNAAGGSRFARVVTLLLIAVVSFATASLQAVRIRRLVRRRSDPSESDPRTDDSADRLVRAGFSYDDGDSAGGR